MKDSISMKASKKLVLTAVAARQTTDLGTSCVKTSGKRLASAEVPVYKNSRMRPARAGDAMFFVVPCKINYTSKQCKMQEDKHLVPHHP